MLPTYPVVERFREEENSAIIRKMARRMSPMLDAVQHRVQFEGRKHVIERHDDTVSDTDMASVKAELTIPADMSLEEFDFSRLESLLQGVATQMRSSF
ncbi:hypothetical protein D3C85_1402410 [compost metagenome]